MQAVKVVDSFDLAEWPVMDAFLAENYRAGYVMRNRALFDWHFGRDDEPGTANVICAYSDGRLVGILGYMPMDLFWGDAGKPLRGAWMANWMVTPDFRHGVGALIMRRLMEKFPVLLGQGAGLMNVPIAKILKFTIFDRIPRYLAVFDVARTRAFMTGDEGGDMDGLAIGEAAPGDNVNDGLPPGYDPDWAAYPSIVFGTVRSAQYLDWRYLRHPVFSYRIKSTGGARHPAVCIYRVENTRGSAQYPVGRITELFFPDTESGRQDGIRVLKAALADLQRADCAFADHYCSSGPCRSVIEAAGMETATDLPLATRLSPIEATHHHQNLEVWSKPANPYPSDLGDFYITKADGDQDRPN